MDSLVSSSSLHPHTLCRLRRRRGGQRICTRADFAYTSFPCWAVSQPQAPLPHIAPTEFQPGTSNPSTPRSQPSSPAHGSHFSYPSHEVPPPQNIAPAAAMPPPATSHAGPSASSAKIDPKVISSAVKQAKIAINSLNFDDVDSASKFSYYRNEKKTLGFFSIFFWKLDEMYIGASFRVKIDIDLVLASCRTSSDYISKEPDQLSFLVFMQFQ